MSAKISIIVPVYNRPNEVDELLQTLTTQSCKEFEVVIVEDGSKDKCTEVIDKYKEFLDITYIFKDNSGPGLSRNVGVESARCPYVVFLDSDCILPPQYVQVVTDMLESNYTDAFGGPDSAHNNFSNIQKAVSYSMTSFFTTGGIRGGGEKLGKFQPRSFNMGYSKEVFQKTGGFSGMRFGEDIDMSIRILENGFRTMLLKEAFVYHKRRTNMKSFFKQVFNSGIARINLEKRHKGSLKAVHCAPAVFTMGCLLLILGAIFLSPYLLLPIPLYALLIFADSSLRNKSLTVGLLSIATSFIQLWGYGTGFLLAFWKRYVLHKGEFAAFVKGYK